MDWCPRTRHELAIILDMNKTTALLDDAPLTKMEPGDKPALWLIKAAASLCFNGEDSTLGIRFMLFCPGGFPEAGARIRSAVLPLTRGLAMTHTNPEVRHSALAVRAEMIPSALTQDFGDAVTRFRRCSR
jgi:hypothetical protein